MNIPKRHWMLAGILTSSLLAPGSTWANSKFLNVQGTLTTSGGSPLTGNQTVTFRLYTSSTASVGSAVWTESDTVALSTGLLNVTLGTVTALDSLAFNQLYYLGIQVAGDSNELSPRQQLGASAYAQGSLGNFNVGNNLVVGSSITTTGYVGISTASPVTTLDVNGSAQFGSGATKSTFTATGNLSVGGNGILVGTMTVQGSAFSVGGSTFAIAGGSVSIGSVSRAAMLDVNGSAQFGAGAARSTFTATGLLKLASPGVQWADGSTLTTAGTVALLPSTQTFSGGNTFTSSVTMPAGSFTTLNGTVEGYMPFFSSANFTSAGTICSTNTAQYVAIPPGNKRIFFHIVAVGTGSQWVPAIRFSTTTSGTVAWDGLSSTSGHYKWTSLGYDPSNGTQGGSDAATNTNYAALIYGEGQPATSTTTLDGFFDQSPGKTSITGWAGGGYSIAAGSSYPGTGSGTFIYSAPSTITLMALCAVGATPGQLTKVDFTVREISP